MACLQSGARPSCQVHSLGPCVLTTLHGSGLMAEELAPGARPSPHLSVCLFLVGECAVCGD